MGGLNIPDFATMVETSRLKWIKKIYAGTESPWNYIFEKYMSDSSIHLNTLLHSNYDIKRLGLKKTSIPTFYTEVLTIWSKLGNTQPVDKKNVLWYNKNILIKGTSIFYKDMFQAGIWLVNDLYDDAGNIVSFTTWVNRGVLKSSLIKWMGLIQITKRLFTQNFDNEGITNLVINVDNKTIALERCPTKYLNTYYAVKSMILP
jgi:hypothetical protein